MKKLSIWLMQMLYKNKHTDRRHFIQYEEYKKRLNELEKQEKEFYWREIHLPEIDKNIDYSLDYNRELDRLISLGYRQYCIDFDCRCNTVYFSL